MLKDSSKYLTHARNIGNGGETIFFTFRLLAGFIMGVCGSFRLFDDHNLGSYF